MKILVVEDETAIREAIVEFLRSKGHLCSGAVDGAQALRYFQRSAYDLILLDIMLPKINGLEVLKRIRQVSKVPAIMITAFGDEEYKVRAFTHLADGYVEKPFSLSQLAARVQAIAQRHYAGSQTFVYGDCTVDFSAYAATYRGQPVTMHAKEIEVLQCLLAHADKVLTRSQIIELVWKDQADVPYDRVIDVYIKELRRKLGLDCITTVRNVGYKLSLRRFTA